MRLLLLLVVISIILTLLLGMVIVNHLLEGLYLVLQVGYQSLANCIPLLSGHSKR